MKSQQRKKRLDPNTLQLIRQIVGGLLVMALIAVLVVSAWYVSRLPNLTIDTVTVSGGETIDHELIRTLAETELEGEYLRLVPKRFTLTYPESAIVAAVQGVDRVKDITVERTSRTTVRVSFSEFVPDTLWCNSDMSTCMFMDSVGYAFARAPQLSGGSFLRFEKLGVEPVANVQAFTEAEYYRLLELVDLLERNSWFVEKVATDVAGDAYLTLTEGGELKVALTDEPAQVVENLFTVLSSNEFSDIGPGEFEYIDLRFGNKVFVNELEPEVPESQAGLAATTSNELE